MTTRRTTLTLALALALAAATALGCATGNEDNRAGTENVAPAGAGNPPPGGQPESALPMDGKTAQVYKDGLKVLVTPARKYRVPAAAAGHTAGNTAVTFKVTIVNGTGTQADITLTTVQVSLGADGITAEPIYAPGLDSMIDAGKIAPGRRKTLTLAYSAATKDTTVIDVTVQPGFLDYADALFTGKVTS